MSLSQGSMEIDVTLTLTNTYDAGYKSGKCRKQPNFGVLTPGPAGPVQETSARDNGCVESFNSGLRDKLPNRELFLSVDDLRCCGAPADGL